MNDNDVITMDQGQDGSATETTGGFLPTLLTTLLIGGVGYLIGKAVECGVKAVGNAIATSKAKAAQQLPARNVEDETAD